MSPESTEVIRNLEQQELNLRRGAAAKRLAGWTKDGSTEEIASWSVEAERISREVEAMKRKLQEAIEKESTMKDVRMSDEGLDGLDGSLSSSCGYCNGARPCDLESVELESGWTVGGFN